jgi:ferredoxin-NADP reductase/predicted pyridoxine 5'-phosphate oxidase superfamily flavin-nucleotide-binding protein
MAFSIGMPWNEGEEKMHSLLRVPPQDNPTSTMLTPQASFMFQRAPLLAFGTLDSQDRPWVTLWGGSPGFSESLGQGMVGTRTLVDGEHDPVIQALVADGKGFEKPRSREDAKLIAGLAIDLMTRKRVKTAGRLVGCMVQEVETEPEGDTPAKSQNLLQIVTKIEQSLGNCPKYLNQYEIRPAPVASKLVTEGASLSDEGRDLITAADMFFLSTSTEDDMDVNHRGGPQGFVRIMSRTEIVYPEYSGNRLYQSLGNLQLNPKIGLVFPNYSTGDVLYITGTTEILTDKDATNVLPGSNLAVKITINKARFVSNGLPFRGTRQSPSPYNPRVRPLASEGNLKAAVSNINNNNNDNNTQVAQLTKKTLLTPSIARFTFSVPDGGIAYAPAQWIALDFKSELDTGYEHMRDDDPTSLNDDFVRTFTISSTPSSSLSSPDGTSTPSATHEREFDITIRKVGPVTRFLFSQNERAGFQVPVLGVGGDFSITKSQQQQEQQEQGIIPFIAGGVGITPLLAQVPLLDLSPHRFRLFWTLRGEDAGLVADTFERYPGLAACTKVFFTGLQDSSGVIGLGDAPGATIEHRRLTKSGLQDVEAETWYLCAGKGMRREVLGWLEGKKVVFEDFDY